MKMPNISIEDYEKIFNEGYESGYDVGMDDGMISGYRDGENIGYSNGKIDGYAEGQEDGYQEGYKKGRDDGFSDGYATKTAEVEDNEEMKMQIIDDNVLKGSMDELNEKSKFMNTAERVAKSNMNYMYDPDFSKSCVDIEGNIKFLTSKGNNSLTNILCVCLMAYMKGKEAGHKEGRFEGYHDGVTIGYLDGWDDGYEVGHSDRSDKRKEDKVSADNNRPANIDVESYTYGYKRGHDDGFKDGYSTKIEDSKPNTADASYDEGYKDGYDEGDEDGYERGYEEGYERGWAGLKKDKEDKEDRLLECNEDDDEYKMLIDFLQDTSKHLDFIKGNTNNTPEYYNKFEHQPIAAMKERMTPEQFEGFCWGNAIKYILRYGTKDTKLSDINKAIQYCMWIKERLEEDKKDAN